MELAKQKIIIKKQTAPCHKKWTDSYSLFPCYKGSCSKSMFMLKKGTCILKHVNKLILFSMIACQVTKYTPA